MGGSSRRIRRRASSRIAAANSSRKSKYVEMDLNLSSEESSQDEEVCQITTCANKRSRNTADAAPKSKKKSAKSNRNDDGGEGRQVEQRPPISRDLGDLINCKVCLREPASPIHCCANGHIICGICVDKGKKCGLCQTDLQVSNFAELLSRQFELKLACQNQKSGCTAVIPAAEMKFHIETCYYRDIICTENKNGACAGTKIPMSEYSKHLQEFHQCLVGSSRRNILSSEDENLLCGKASVPRSHYWPTGILENGGNTFLMHSKIHENSAFVWITVLGSREIAEKYAYKFKLCKNMDGGGKMTTSWALPVLPFHERKYVENYAAISPKMLLEFCTRVEIEGVEKLQFDSSYKICKKIVGPVGL